MSECMGRPIPQLGQEVEECVVVRVVVNDMRFGGFGARAGEDGEAEWGL